MLQSFIIIIGCYLFSAAMVHAVHRWFPRLQGSVLHYVLVTKDSEQRMELVVRAISLYAWMQGKESRISVIDEGSKDQTIAITERLDRDDRFQLIRTRNWYETERVVRNFKKSVKVAGYTNALGELNKSEQPRTSGASGTSRISGTSRTSGTTKILRQSRMSGNDSPEKNESPEKVTVIYINRREDRAKIPLFSNG